MIQYVPFRPAIIAMITLPACVVLGSPSKLLAQGNAQGNIHVFKSGGGDRSSMGRKPPPAPAVLTQLDLKKLAGMVGSEPGSVYAKLTPQNPSATNRGALVFLNPTLVEGGENYATWVASGSIISGGSEGGLALWLRPGTGKKYLIDCAVESPSQGAHFIVSGPSGNAAAQFEAVPGGQHLSFVLYATDNKWQKFQITAAGLKSRLGVSTGVDWTFYSCEATNL